MKVSILLQLASVSFLSALLFGCTSSEVGESKDVSQQTIYQQYQVSYSETEEQVKLYCQFRFAGDKGTTLVLTDPSNIQFDDVVIPVDSSDYEGAFYKLNLPVEKCMGDHQFSFTDINKKKYDNHFYFETPKLLNIQQKVVKDQSLGLQFESFQPGPDDYIELATLDSDSAFSINFTQKDSGKFLIPSEELLRQKSGPLNIAVTFHRKIPLQQSTTEGGVLEIIYALKPFSIQLK